MLLRQVNVPKKVSSIDIDDNRVDVDNECNDYRERKNDRENTNPSLRIYWMTQYAATTKATQFQKFKYKKTRADIKIDVG